MYFYPGVVVPAYNLTGGSRVQGLKSVQDLKKVKQNKPMKNSVDLKFARMELKYYASMQKHTQRYCKMIDVN